MEPKDSKDIEKIRVKTMKELRKDQKMKDEERKRITS